MQCSTLCKFYVTDYRYLNQHLSIDDLDYVKDKPKYKRNRIDTTSVRVNDTNDSTDTNDINIEVLMDNNYKFNVRTVNTDQVIITGINKQ